MRRRVAFSTVFLMLSACLLAATAMIPPVILVESGSFRMGDTIGGGRENENPVHKVILTYNFYIGKYEVTFEEYDLFCESTGASKPDDQGWGRGRQPVMNVTWWDATHFCNWLSETEGFPLAYDSQGNLLDSSGNVTTDVRKVAGYRLPTEAEWEFASRGGNLGSGLIYSGSNDVNEVAWYRSNSDARAREIGTKAPNELGLYDMSGNLWEWCSDTWYEYSDSVETDPYYSAFVDSGTHRIWRGGSWGSSEIAVRVSNRNDLYHNYAYSYLGFRIARTEF